MQARPTSILKCYKTDYKYRLALAMSSDGILQASKITLDFDKQATILKVKCETEISGQKT